METGQTALSGLLQKMPVAGDFQDRKDCKLSHQSKGRHVKLTQEGCQQDRMDRKRLTEAVIKSNASAATTCLQELGTPGRQVLLESRQTQIGWQQEDRTQEQSQLPCVIDARGKSRRVGKQCYGK
eukprot:1158423-Pelagomonas_calceolata.AAC.4